MPGSLRQWPPCPQPRVCSQGDKRSDTLPTHVWYTIVHVGPTPISLLAYQCKVVVVPQVPYADGRTTRTFESGVKVTLFADGTRRTKWPTSRQMVAFPNGDLRVVEADQKEDYFFAQVCAVGAVGGD